MAPKLLHCVFVRSRQAIRGSGAMRLIGIAAMLVCAPGAFSYSVLTHEAIIDSAWDGSIQTLLQKRFPSVTPDQLIEAHAYAYGGAIIQDMGYYPFGSKFFSDLAHYVRSGDFVLNLIRESQTLDEYAFALGALAHYAADTEGHPLAVNPSVPILYPKLERKYGSVMTYEQNPAAHMKAEFGFDVLQVARGNYAPKAYHDFIGFQVAKPVLERAFADTYCLQLGDAFRSVDLALGTYRFTVRGLIPEATKVAWAQKSDAIVKETPGMTRRRFIYNVSRQSYEKEWGRDYRRPGPGARVLAWVFRVMPKIGPMRALSFRSATPRTAELFEFSFNRTLDRYRAFLAAEGAGTLKLPDLDFDTGQVTHAGEYRLADKTYATLLRKLDGKDFAGITPELRECILAYYRDLKAPIATKKDEDQWHKLLLALAKLKAAGPRPTS